MGGLARKCWVIVLPAILVIPATAGVAQAVVLQCGAQVAQNTVLTADIGPCSSTAVRIVADGVTLDLNGHTISGSPASGDGAGVLLVNRTGVTVMNGAITGFDGGVVIQGGSGNTVSFISAVGNISFETGPRLAGDGIAIESSQNNRILNNNTVNNGPYSGIGLYSEVDSAHPRNISGVSSGNLIQGNTVVGNIQGRTPNNVVNNDNIGIRLEPSSSGNTIVNNKVQDNGLDGITMFVRSSDNVVRGNVVTHNGFYRVTARRGNGIGMQIGGANRNLVEGNTVVGNADNGIAVRNGSVSNVIRNNYAVGNAALPPASTQFGPTFDLLDNNPNCDNNVWRDNVYGTVFPACAGDTP